MYNKAIKYWKKCTEVTPQFLDNRFNLGRLCFKSEQYNEPIKYYEEIIKIDPLNHSAFCNLANCHINIYKYQDAIEYDESALSIDLYDFDSYTNLTKCYNEDPKSNKENICEYCKLKFSEGEIMTMASLFKKYGGFFNKLDSQKLTLKQILENLLNEIRNENDFSRMIELNEITLHHGLLGENLPKKFMEELKKF